MGKNKGLLIVLSGPSGVGKGTVRKKLFENPNVNFEYSISMTTRPKRPGEVEGKDYYFVSYEEFQNRIKENKFLEHAEFVGNCYGTPLDKVNDKLNEGIDVFLEIEVKGAHQVREKMKDCIMIFLLPPSKDELFNRLKKRGTESIDVINERIKKASREFKYAKDYDYIIVNDDVDSASQKILSIINAEHLKTSRSIDNYSSLLDENNEN